MRKRIRLWITVSILSVLLLGSLLYGFVITLEMRRSAQAEEDFFASSILDQSSSMNRVFLAALRLAAYPPDGEKGAAWRAGKIELGRGLVSHAEIPPFVDPAVYARFITKDPLLLVPRLESVEREYREGLAALAACVRELTAARADAEQSALLSRFDLLLGVFMDSVKQRSQVMIQLEGTYHSQLRANLARDRRDIRLVIMLQGIAVIIASFVVLMQFRAQSREMRALSGLIPICSHCKKVRDDKGYWNQVESYVRAHSNASFSHGICPDCMKELYGELLADTPSGKRTS